ncbi:MAG: ABC transporter permease [Synergistaceae bacterium]|nr:ABC transporter permease [Synergistaceae bacterium]
MHRFILKRLLMMIPIVIGVSLLIFVIIDMIPGDPGSSLLGAGAHQEDIDMMNEQLGYNRPLIQRYFSYMYNAVFKLDFGKSYATKKPVLTEIASRMPVSLRVAFNAILFSLVFGVPLGVLSAVKQNTVFDRVPTGIALLMASQPAFLIGLVLMLIFSLRLGWFPATGIESWKSYVMPMIALGLPYGGRQLRFTRSSMLETIRQDYVRTARAKGASERLVIWRHAMKNALLPVITVAGNSFGILIGGAIATETLFGLPGLGSFIVAGIRQKDVPVVTGGIIVFAVVFAFVILAVDLSYAMVDPRIKAKYSGGRR